MEGKKRIRVVSYRRAINFKNHVRVRFELERGRVVQFMAQLECMFDEKSVPVIRYDTAHRFAHRDALHPYGDTVKTKMTTQDYNKALTIAK